MILLFKFEFNGNIVHVLHLRGRTAFLATEIGAAAGYGEGGRRFVDLIIREWAAALDEDEDVAQITGGELAAIRREVPLPDNATLALVLFRTGIERTLMRSDAKFAKPLLGYLHRDVLSRVATLTEDPSPPASAPASGDSDGSDGGGAPPAPPPRLPLWGLAACDHAATHLRRIELVGAVLRYHAIRRVSAQLEEDGFLDEGLAADLQVEALEELLGRRLRTQLPSFGKLVDSPLAA